jgi:hypothetical protein
MKANRTACNPHVGYARKFLALSQAKWSVIEQGLGMRAYKRKQNLAFFLQAPPTVDVCPSAQQLHFPVSL